jgi:hypothetical protein
MITDELFFPHTGRVKQVTRDAPGEPGDSILATRDHAVIREWARVFDAEPATGEESPSGPASSMKVADGGTGLRFNFPGIGRFRLISWTEWFDHFNRHDLTFVFENPGMRNPPSARYRLVRTEELGR